MDLKIKNKSIATEAFIKSYLKLYMLSILSAYKNDGRFKQLDKEFDFESYKICQLALASLEVSKINDYYIVRLDKRLKVNGTLISPLVKMISYGNLNVKGFPIIDIIFSYVNNNIDKIMKEVL